MKTLKIESAFDLKNIFREMYDFTFKYFIEFPGTQFYLKLLKKRRVRSLKQNSLYWVWLTYIEMETGQEKDDLHSFFKERFLKSEKIEILNHSYLKTQSTTALNTKEFTEYLDKIQLFMSEQGYTLIYPDDERFNDFIQTINENT